MTTKRNSKKSNPEVTTTSTAPEASNTAPEPEINPTPTEAQPEAPKAEEVAEEASTEAKAAPLTLITQFIAEDATITTSSRNFPNRRQIRRYLRRQGLDISKLIQDSTNPTNFLISRPAPKAPEAKAEEVTEAAPEAPTAPEA